MQIWNKLDKMHTKKIKIERSNKSCLVWIVSVLNVLGKAVLGPVDLLTVHRILESSRTRSNSTQGSTESLLLILKVVPHFLFEWKVSVWKEGKPIHQRWRPTVYLLTGPWCKVPMFLTPWPWNLDKDPNCAVEHWWLCLDPALYVLGLEVLLDYLVLWTAQFLSTHHHLQ